MFAIRTRGRSAKIYQIEITREIGEENVFLFGNLAEDVEDLRHNHVRRLLV